MRNLGLGLGLTRGGAGVSAPFTISLTGLSTDSLGDYAQVGDHAGIGYTIDPDNGTEAVKWSFNSDAAATGIGTGTNPPDITAGDGGTLWLHVTDGGETVSRSVAIRRGPGTGPTIADQDAWSVGVAITPIDISASGTGLTFDYTVENLPAGLTVDTENEQISGTPTEAFDDTITVIPEDQYGRTEEYVEAFAASAVLPAVGTFGALTNQSFTENSGDQTYQHAAATGAGLTFTYAQVGSVAGVTYNPSTRTFTFDTDALAVQSGTSLTVSATDQFGRAAAGSPRSFTFDIENFTLSETAEGTFEIDGATGEVTITVTSPAAYADYDAGNGAGVFIFNGADLASGPVNLVPPLVGLSVDADSSGSINNGDTLSVEWEDPPSTSRYPGLWVYDPDVGAIGTASYQWQADAAGNGTFADISGATSAAYTLTSSESGDDVLVIETLPQTNISPDATATSAAVSVASGTAAINSITPAPGGGLIVDYTGTLTVTPVPGGGVIMEVA